MWAAVQFECSFVEFNIFTVLENDFHFAVLVGSECSVSIQKSIKCCMIKILNIWFLLLELCIEFKIKVQLIANSLQHLVHLINMNVDHYFHSTAIVFSFAKYFTTFEGNIGIRNGCVGGLALEHFQHLNRKQQIYAIKQPQTNLS